MGRVTLALASRAIPRYVRARMKSSIDRRTIDHVARLACLSLTDAEADRLTKDVARIVAYVEELASVDTADVPPTSHVQLDRLPLRGDEVKPGLSHDAALAQAPRAEHGGFAVPTFVEGSAQKER
jgi:aspartyl-tRNA(Asn)/glutamyl-tRNA(Gln) amidotransferase subunit C